MLPTFATAPPPPPRLFTSYPELFEKVEFLTSACAFKSLRIAPPSTAVLFVKLEFSTYNSPELRIAPP